ncbi:hypothetical protein [Novipirellula artificiosorum]|uniref:Uncharacterized protein n=1 Tax=Novipirellula artificiosorum TaxID=2528016 RepID=A0A5C6DVJ3_9BACT|nr:hypothetical protein [Novipirellula artificiosorum]TWU40632.1 hypothetical protein Poly41_14660 [Novipirellula artificiosorum]
MQLNHFGGVSCTSLGCSIFGMVTYLGSPFDRAGFDHGPDLLPQLAPTLDGTSFFEVPVAEARCTSLVRQRSPDIINSIKHAEITMVRST